VLSIVVNIVAQKEEATLEFTEDDAEFYAYATPSRLPVMFGAFVFQD
jgi:hypothetical protein